MVREQGVSPEPTRSVCVFVVTPSHHQESGDTGHVAVSQCSGLSGHQVAHQNGILDCV